MPSIRFTSIAVLTGVLALTACGGGGGGAGPIDSGTTTTMVTEYHDVASTRPLGHGPVLATSNGVPSVPSRKTGTWYYFHDDASKGFPLQEQCVYSPIGDGTKLSWTQYNNDAVVDGSALSSLNAMVLRRGSIRDDSTDH